VKRSGTIRLALHTYEWLWRGATPFLGRNHRLRDGLPQRLGRSFPIDPMDIWIQAASAGESYLAGMILDTLGEDTPYRILVTTNTRQGKDILDAVMQRLRSASKRDQWASAFFPFDRPSLMQKAVDAIQPRIMVLLETEIWPGLMNAIKVKGIPMIIVNGRMQAKSLRHYQLWPRFWHALGPDRIMAVSPADADRYVCLYGTSRVSVMPNMKFDRVSTSPKTEQPDHVRRLIPAGTPFVVLGSVRQEEEAAVDQLIGYLLDRRPGILIGLFPRHMHRTAPWQKRLKAAGITCHLRSRIDAPVNPGGVILWDVFGELTSGYAAATSAFVGGSLAPLGGQNFLEPLTCGIIPTIGPSWKTFEWVGPEIFSQGLVHVAEDWRQAGDHLLKAIEAPPPPQTVIDTLQRYVAERQGGTAMAVQAIEQLLEPQCPADRDVVRQGQTS